MSGQELNGDLEAPVGSSATDGLEGARLQEEGRNARQQRARDRSVRGRIEAFMADRPAWMRRTTFIAIGVAALLVALVLVDVLASFGRVHPGVHVGDVGVGALRPEQAALRVDEAIGSRLTEPVVLAFEEQSWETGGEALGASLDAEASVADAMRVGRSGSAWDRVRTRASLWFRPETVPVRVGADEQLLAGFLDGISSEIDRAPVSASVVIEGTEARLDPAVLGLAVRTGDLTSGLLDSLAATERTVAVPVDFLPVRVTDEGARQAFEDAIRMLEGPVTVFDGDRSWEFATTSIAEWIDFAEVPDPSLSSVATDTADVVIPGTADDPQAPAATDSIEATTTPLPVAEERFILEAFISSQEASATITDVVGEAGTPPVDARFVVGGGSVTIVPSQDGVGPDIEALSVEMTRVLKTGGERRVQLRTERVEPEITTERAEGMGISERIATYSTNFSSANRQRVSNIHTLSAALDGTLVPPGGTFSFNDTIGPRTAAKGYQEAPAIIGGRLVPSLGGGICQVATTLFNTVFESGLPVVERRNHSFYISSYPKGRDATVSWGGVDFKFRNDTENWVLIATAYSNTSVTVSFYGTDPGYEVRSSTGEFTDIRPHPVNEVMDAGLAAGLRVVEDGGVDGRRIVVRRTVHRGGAVIREDNFTSTYQPKVETVRVGTRADGSGDTTPTASP